MSDRPQGDDWWLASDGKWYPPQSRPAAPSTPVPGAADGVQYVSFLGSGTTRATRILAFIAAGLSIVSAIATVIEINKFDAYIDFGGITRLDELVDAEEISAGVISFSVLAGLVLFILLLVWMNQAYKATERFEATGQRWSSGWAVGGWFIPFGNLVIPKLVMNEIDRISSPANSYPVRSQWPGQRVLTESNWWWGLFLVGAIAIQGGVAITGAEVEAASFDADTYRLGLWFTAGGFVLSSAASIVLARMVKLLGSRLHRPSGSTTPQPRRADDAQPDTGEWWQS